MNAFAGAFLEPAVIEPSVQLRLLGHALHTGMAWSVSSNGFWLSPAQHFMALAALAPRAMPNCFFQQRFTQPPTGQNSEHHPSQWALPDLNSKLQIPVSTPGPQQQAQDRSGHPHIRL